MDGPNASHSDRAVRNARSKICVTPKTRRFNDDMNHHWTWSGFFDSLLGVVQWTVAIVSVVGTLALFGWILKMILKKDKAT